MTLMKSDALVLINRILRVGGGAPEGTDLDTENLAQVIDVTDAARRTLALGAAEGWYYGLIDMVHAAAGDEFEAVDPYAPGTTIVPTVSGFPPIVKPGTDVWLIGATVRRTAGTGTLDGLSITLSTAASHQAWGVDSAGSAVSGVSSMQIAFWTALFTGVNALAFGIAGDGSSMVKLNLRLPRGTTIQIHSSAAGASATFRLNLILGVFPEAIGQDASQGG